MIITIFKGSIQSKVHLIRSPLESRLSIIVRRRILVWGSLLEVTVHHTRRSERWLVREMRSRIGLLRWCSSEWLLIWETTVIIFMESGWLVSLMVNITVSEASLVLALVLLLSIRLVVSFSYIWSSWNLILVRKTWSEPCFLYTPLMILILI
jgi:hypothetical protein